MRLILHIGTEKTGTTSIQSYLSDNAPALEDAGIFYSAALERPNNAAIAAYGMDPESGDHLLEARGIFDSVEHLAFRRRLEPKFAEEVARARERGCHTFVISNEHCHSRLTRPELVESVAALLRPHFNAISVICFLRPQVDLAVSSASTHARLQRVDPDFLTRIAADDPYYDYAALLDRWAAAFGEKAILPVAFARADSVSAFCAAAGLPPTQDGARYRQNEALDVRTIAILNALEVHRYRLPGEFSRNAIPFIAELPVTERLRAPLSAAQEMQARFDAGNAALCRRFPAIAPADLVPDWSRFDEAGNLHWLSAADPLAPVLGALVDGFNLEVLMERTSALLAASERADARSHKANAQRFLDRAARHMRLLSVYAAPNKLSGLRRQIRQQAQQLGLSPDEFG